MLFVCLFVVCVRNFSLLSFGEEAEEEEEDANQSSKVKQYNIPIPFANQRLSSLSE